MTSTVRTDSSRGPVGHVAVIIPTYNELANLEDITGRVRAAVPAADILVVDDNSPDGTGDLADKLAAGDDHVKVLHRPGKNGLGAAYIAGFGWALERGYGTLVEMDADGSHDPAELPGMLTALADADLVIGSRWVPGGQLRNWPRSRLVLSRGGNLYVRLALGIAVRDATGGYRAYRADTLRAIGLDQVESQGYCFQVDLTRRAAAMGMIIREVPITFTERSRGASKMSNAIVAEAFWRVAAVGRGEAAAPGLLPLARRAAAAARAAARAGPALGALALPGGVRPARCRVAAALAPDHREPLGQDFLEVGERAPLHQHVPVAARRLGLLGRGRVTGDRERGRAADPALPVSGQLGLGGEGHREPVPLGAVESNLLARGQVGVAVVLVAGSSESGAP